MPHLLIIEEHPVTIDLHVTYIVTVVSALADMRDHRLEGVLALAIVAALWCLCTAPCTSTTRTSTSSATQHLNSNGK